VEPVDRLRDVLADDRILWFVMRGSGLVLLVLLTASVALGVAAATTGTRRTTGPVRRVALQTVHRDVSLLALVLLAVHASTAAVHDYVEIGWVDLVVPFVGRYDPLWVGLGALALDLTLAAAVVALIRRRVDRPGWRVVHAVGYAAWAVAVVHAVGIGTDVTRPWVMALLASCAVITVTAVVARLARRDPDDDATVVTTGRRAR
jgi:predicted ferric reductase